MAGSDPIWLVEGSFGRWIGADTRVKSIWVLSRRVAGGLVVQGRRLDGPGRMRFQAGMNASPAEQAVVPDSRNRSVIPGGATSEHMERYEFVMMYLIYPSPGCWEIRARLGDHETSIVVRQSARDNG
ncbi:MAG: hypothetical protein ACE5JX_02875 [Acidobacteriota bacterium]